MISKQLGKFYVVITETEVSIFHIKPSLSYYYLGSHGARRLQEYSERWTIPDQNDEQSSSQTMIQSSKLLSYILNF